MIPQQSFVFLQSVYDNVTINGFHDIEILSRQSDCENTLHLCLIKG